MLARLIALAIHELAAPVIAEYRKLDAPPSCDHAPSQPDTHRYDPASVTAIETERASSWDHDKTPPVTAFGFGRAGD